MSATAVRSMPLEELVPAPYNPRKISPPSAAGLRASLKRFGLVQPIVWNRRTKRIVGGHQRVDALRALGHSSADVIEVDLSETDEKALNLTLNNPTISGEFTDGLADLLDELAASMPETDFKELALDDLEALVPKGALEIVEDEVPEPPKVPVTKPGDLWVLGRHRVLCGDNTKPDAIERATGGQAVALLLTDPPYGIAIVKGSRGKIGGDKAVTIGRVGSSQPQPLGFGRVWQDGMRKARAPLSKGGKGITVKAGEYLKIAGDDRPFDPAPLLALGREQIIFGAHNFAHQLPISRCWIVWDKENGDGSFGDAELAWASHDRAVKLYKHKWNGLVRAGGRDVEGVRRMHPTQKPVGLFGKILTDFTEPRDVVLDPFLGSGTTLIAAEQLDRVCYGLEIEPRYVDVIVERWQNLTSQKAKRG